MMATSGCVAIRGTPAPDTGLRIGNADVAGSPTASWRTDSVWAEQAVSDSLAIGLIARALHGSPERPADVLLIGYVRNIALATIVVVGPPNCNNVTVRAEDPGAANLRLPSVVCRMIDQRTQLRSGARLEFVDDWSGQVERQGSSARAVAPAGRYYFRVRYTDHQSPELLVAWPGPVHKP